MAVELGYFTLPVANIARAKEFYAAVFDWDFDEDPTNPSYAHVNNTALPFGLHEAGAGDVRHLYFRVADTAEVLERITGGRRHP